MFVFTYMYIYMYIYLHIYKHSHRQTMCKNKDHEVKCSNDKSFPTLRPSAQA